MNSQCMQIIQMDKIKYVTDLYRYPYSKRANMFLVLIDIGAPMSMLALCKYRST